MSDLAWPSEILLASGSDRRREILETLGFSVEVQPPEIDESPQEGEKADAYVRRLARQKVATVRERSPGRRIPTLGADTVVEYEGDIIGKPGDPDEARAILERLSGTAHEVVTGVCVVWTPQGGDDPDAPTLEWSEVVTSRVALLELRPEAIAAYIKTGEPRGKAGAYGIQGRGAALVRSVGGSYSNVVGLPVDEFQRKIGRWVQKGLPEGKSAKSRPKIVPIEWAVVKQAGGDEIEVVRTATEDSALEIADNLRLGSPGAQFTVRPVEGG